MRDGAAFIFASTKDVYGPFPDNYREVPESCPTLFAGQAALEWSKLIAERYVEFYSNTGKFRSCIFRMSTVFAPLSEGNTPNFVGHYVDCINKGIPFPLASDGKPVRDLLHVDDFSNACAAFGESIIKRGLYNIGGGSANAVSLSSLVETLEDVSGLQAVIDPKSEMPDPRPLNYVTDLSFISHELGWSPRIGLSEGLKTLFG